MTLDYGYYGYELSYPINSSVTGFKAYLSYFCGNDSSCIINKEKDSINENTIFLFNFQTRFPRIAHQNSLKPILDDYGDKIDYGFGLFVDFKNYVLRILNWKVIKYIEKKEFLEYLINYSIEKLNILQDVMNHKSLKEQTVGQGKLMVPIIKF